VKPQTKGELISSLPDMREALRVPEPPNPADDLLPWWQRFERPRVSVPRMSGWAWYGLFLVLLTGCWAMYWDGQKTHDRLERQRQAQAERLIQTRKAWTQGNFNSCAIMLEATGVTKRRAAARCGTSHTDVAPVLHYTVSKP
jgi:hypothetical protein